MQRYKVFDKVICCAFDFCSAPLPPGSLRCIAPPCRRMLVSCRRISAPADGGSLGSGLGGHAESHLRVRSVMRMPAALRSLARSVGCAGRTW